MVGDAVSFDLDGTLTDPGVGIFRSVAHAVDELGLSPLEATQLTSLVGPPLQESFASLGLGPAEVTTAVAAYPEYFSDRGLYENTVYVGVPEVLEALRSEGFGLGMATSKPGLFGERILEHFDLTGYFTTVVGSKMDGSRRHKDEVIAGFLVELPDVNVVAIVGDRAQDRDQVARFRRRARSRSAGSGGR